MDTGKTAGDGQRNKMPYKDATLYSVCFSGLCSLDFARMFLAKPRWCEEKPSSRRPATKTCTDGRLSRPIISNGSVDGLIERRAGDGGFFDKTFSDVHLFSTSSSGEFADSISHCGAALERVFLSCRLPVRRYSQRLWLSHRLNLLYVMAVALLLFLSTRWILRILLGPNLSKLFVYVDFKLKLERLQARTAFRKVC